MSGFHSSKWKIPVALAILCFGVAQTAVASDEIPAAKSPDLETLLRDAKSPSSKVRVEAIKKLASEKSERAIHAIAAGLKDDDANVRFIASGVKDFEALTNLLKDPIPRVRQQAARALGERAEEKRVELLIETLQDRESVVRCTAADALGKTKEKRVIPPLEAMLKETDPEVAYSVKQSLQSLGYDFNQKQ